MFRRLFLSLIVVGAVTGCTMEEPVDNMRPSEVQVTSVSVGFKNAERIEASLQSLEIGASVESFANALDSVISEKLIPATRSGQKTVSVQVIVDSLTLGSTVPGLIRPSFIPPFSQIVATIVVTDVRSAETLLRQRFVGDDNPGGVTFGSVFNAGFSGGKSRTKAYNDTISGFADDLLRELFSSDSL